MGRRLHQQLRPVRTLLKVHIHCGRRDERGYFIGPKKQHFPVKQTQQGVGVLTLSLALMLDIYCFWNFSGRFPIRTPAAAWRSIPRHAQAHEPCHSPGQAELFLRPSLLPCFFTLAVACRVEIDMQQ